MAAAEKRELLLAEQWFLCLREALKLSPFVSCLVGWKVLLMSPMTLLLRLSRQSLSALYISVVHPNKFGFAFPPPPPSPQSSILLSALLPSLPFCHWVGMWPHLAPLSLPWRERNLLPYFSDNFSLNRHLQAIPH